jgi:hypothetical protein
MGRDHTGGPIHLNWIAILSCAGSLAVSLSIWLGLIRVIEHFVK